MAKTREDNYPDLDKFTTAQLIEIKRRIEKKINSQTQPQHAPTKQLSLHSFLTASRNTTQALELLAYVEKSDYDKIEKLWKNNPDLMFTEIPGNDGVLTTPLQRALYNLDTWTWKPFYEWIQKNNRPDLELKFLQQNAAQKEHIDLNYMAPLFDAYKDMDSLFQKMWRVALHVERDDQWSVFRWLLGDDPATRDKQQRDKQWAKLCKMQREILPWHMIREMCRPCREGWNSEFDKKTAPKNGSYTSINGYMVEYHDIDSSEFASRFGNSMGLVRGIMRDEALGTGCPENLADPDPTCCRFTSDGIREDARLLELLCKIRTHDIASIPKFAQADAPSKAFMG